MRDAGRAGEAPAERMRLTVGGVAALALLLVIGGVLTMFVRQAGRDSDTDPGTGRPEAAVPASSPEVASSPVPTGPVYVAPEPTTQSPLPLRPAVPPATPAPKLPATASFEMAATARSVTVRSADLGPDRYRISLSPGDGPVSARVTDRGTSHRLTLVKDESTPAPAITVTLSTAIRWNLKLSAGNTETEADLTGSRLAALELAGGAHLFKLALPEASGTLPIRLTHGMNQLQINTAGLPVRATLRTGAGKVVVDGRTRDDPRPGRVVTSDGFDEAADRVDLDAVEGVGTLTVTTG